MASEGRAKGARPRRSRAATPEPSAAAGAFGKGEASDEIAAWGQLPALEMVPRLENRKSCCLRMAPEVRKLWRHRIRCLGLRQLGLLSLRACVAMRALRDSRRLGA